MENVISIDCHEQNVTPTPNFVAEDRGMDNVTIIEDAAATQTFLEYAVLKAVSLERAEDKLIIFAAIIRMTHSMLQSSNSKIERSSRSPRKKI